MTNWHDPARESAEGLAYIRSVYLLGGLYIWEFILNLDYEYSIMTKRRKVTLTSPLYLGCRWCTFFVVILTFLSLDMSREISCKARVSLPIVTITFTTFSFLFASALVILRIYALWERNKIILAIASTTWVANIACYAYGISTFRVHSAVTSIDGLCGVDHTPHIRIFFVSVFVTAIVLLILLLSGVLRWKEARVKGGTWWLLYKQGLVCVLIFAFAEVPPVVFIYLNFNEVMNQMFLLPGVVSLTIGASRMHIGLANSASGATNDYVRSSWISRAIDRAVNPVPSCPSPALPHRR